MSNKIDVDNTTKKMGSAEQAVIYFTLRAAEALNTKLYLPSDKLKQYQRSFVDTSRIDIKDHFVTTNGRSKTALRIEVGKDIYNYTLIELKRRGESIHSAENWKNFAHDIAMIEIGIKLRPKRVRRLRPEFDTCDKCGCTEFLCGHIVDGKYI